MCALKKYFEGFTPLWFTGSIMENGDLSNSFKHKLSTAVVDDHLSAIRKANEDKSQETEEM